MAPSHYLNQCWLIISEVQWHSYQGNFTRDASIISHWNPFENYISKISFKFPRGQWNLNSSRLLHWYWNHTTSTSEIYSTINHSTLYTWLHKRYQLQCQETPIKALRYYWHRGHLEDTTDIKIQLLKCQWSHLEDTDTIAQATLKIMGK